MTNRFSKMNFGALGCLIALATLSACGGTEEPTSKTKCSGLMEGDFIITEFLANPAGVDDFKEYVELYNPGDTPVTLDGVKLFYISATTGKETSNWTLKAATIEPKSYFTLGDFDSTVRDGVEPVPYDHLNYTFAKKLSLPSKGTIGLRCGSVVVDNVTYEGASDSRAQILSGDKLSEPANSANWCAIPKDDAYEIPAIVSITYNDDGSIKSEKPNYGTPQKANPNCPVQDEVITVSEGKCIENGVERDIISPEPGKLIFNEIMSHAGTDALQEDGSTKFKAVTDMEYVELYALSRFDLNGVVLSKGTKTGRWAIQSNQCLTMEPNQLAMVARTHDMAANGGIAQVDVLLPKMDLNQSGTISLVLVSGEGEEAVETVIDTVTYSKPSSPNVSWQRSSDKTGAPADSAEAFKASFCASTQTYGDGMVGTPGVANEVCSETPDPSESAGCSAIQAGQLVITEVLADPNGTDDYNEYVEIYNTTGSAISLEGLKFTKSNETGGNPKTFTFGSDALVEAGNYFVFADSESDEVPSYADYAFKGKFGLPNSEKNKLVLACGDTIVDTANYPAPKKAQAILLTTTDASDNDSVSSPAWCHASDKNAIEGTENFGTPGRANDISDCIQ